MASLWRLLCVLFVALLCYSCTFSTAVEWCVPNGSISYNVSCSCNASSSTNETCDDEPPILPDFPDFPCSLVITDCSLCVTTEIPTTSTETSTVWTTTTVTTTSTPPTGTTLTAVTMNNTQSTATPSITTHTTHGTTVTGSSTISTIGTPHTTPIGGPHTTPPGPQTLEVKMSRCLTKLSDPQFTMYHILLDLQHNQWYS
ncbi:integumentary mucin C.1-like [Patiria miniata]|uniref:Uncharacterized protein n=1 Tax=Patiria miniata TaxID=46514 RepID=A0A913ZF32_PATMI|nr:integumentary mucin C.1-like [Patiria miniata]